MEQGFIDILKQLVKEQVKDVLTDSKQCRALLADYTKNEYKKESRLLVQAVEAGVAKAVKEADDLASCKKAKIRDLVDEYGLSHEVAAAIVDTLALVLRGDTSKTIVGSESPPPLTASEKGRVTANNYAEAAALFEKAHDDDDEAAGEKAFHIFEALAGQGHIEAQDYLGSCYFEGTGVEHDIAKAAEWWRKAADQGDRDGQFHMGDCYQFGRGVTQDYQKAAEWYKKAANQGHKAATFMLDSLKGKGTATLW